MITQERLKELLHYCPDTGIFTYLKEGKIAGHNDSRGYITIRIGAAQLKAHRLAFLYITGSCPSQGTDHIDHNKKNNRWDNLREVSHAINQKNKGIAKNNTSGVNGVCWKGNRWEAYIGDSGKYVYLGRFKNKEDAAAARKKADIDYGYHENHGKHLK